MLLNRVKLLICFAFAQIPALSAEELTPPATDTHIITHSSQGLRDNEVELGLRNPKIIATDSSAVAARVASNRTIDDRFWDSYLLPDQINLWLGVDYQNTPQGRAFYLKHADKPRTGDYQGHWEYYRKLRKLHAEGVGEHHDSNYPKSFKQWLYIMYQLHEQQENGAELSNSN